MYCYKCGANIHKESRYCSNCGRKLDSNHLPYRVWLLPTATLFLAILVLGSLFFYESTVNSETEQLLKEGEALALEGEFELARERFKQVLTKRPNHTAAAFNIDVVERGLQYMDLLEEYNFTIVEKELAKEEGRFFEIIKEQYQLLVVSKSINSEQQSMEELVELYEKTKDSASKEVTGIVEVIKGKIVHLAIEQGQIYLEKNQFTEAELEFELGLSFDPTNQKLANYLEQVKTERLVFEEKEQNRLDQAKARAVEEDNFNWTEAGKLLDIHFSYDQEKLVVWGQVKNVGTRPISEIDVHYLVLDEAGKELTVSVAGVTPNLLMPNEIGSFEETLVISEMVEAVEILDCFWTVD